MCNSTNSQTRHLDGGEGLASRRSLSEAPPKPRTTDTSTASLRKTKSLENLRTTLLPNNQTLQSVAVSVCTASSKVPKFEIMPTVRVCVNIHGLSGKFPSVQNSPQLRRPSGARQVRAK